MTSNAGIDEDDRTIEKITSEELLGKIRQKSSEDFSVATF